jgi:Mn2+/Fe2+ NRAMP family transporter
VSEKAERLTTHALRSALPARFARGYGARLVGVITGAADDDPSAIGTYASVGASLGPAFLWIAPAVFPTMFVVVTIVAIGL